MRCARIPLLALTLVISMIGAACDEPLSMVGGPTPNLEPTFSAIQRDIFQASDSSGRPVCVSCHTVANARFAAGLVLTPDAAYAALVNVPSVERPALSRVRAGDPENSYLIHKLEGRSGIVGQRMPFGAGPLTSGQISIIRRWIELGARND